jgi:hypothetical protein
MGDALKKTELVAQLAALRKEQLAATEYVTSLVGRLKL